MEKVMLKPGTLLSPVPPTMISCGTIDTPNIMTVAWTGIVNTIPPMTYISVRPERHSYELIKESGEFVINLATASLLHATDFCGVKSGKEMNKFERCNLTTQQSTKVSAPSIAQSPVQFECVVKQVIPLGSHHMFLAEIVAMGIGKQFFDETGRICMEKMNLLGYSHGQYFELGKQLGSFGHSVKKVKKPIPNKKTKYPPKR
ncbi:MAG: flavin reductase family protein [Oscillospiraceae bacterium]